MSRPPRIHAPGGIYHVIIRGNAREPIFFVANDRLVLNDIVAESTARYQCEVYSYCWMSNHVHAVFRIGDQPLGDAVRWIASRYARYLNKRRGRSGHVFERRHRAILVEKNAYLFQLVKYIHLNPVKARLVQKPEQFRWSSHRAYIGQQHISWLSMMPILGQFGDSLSVARAEFNRFVGESETTDIIGPKRNSHDARNTGQSRPEQRLPVTNILLDQLVATYCAQHGCSPAELSGPSKRHYLARARAEIAERATSSHIASQLDVASYFGRAPEVISRSVRRYCHGYGNR